MLKSKQWDLMNDSTYHEIQISKRGVYFNLTFSSVQTAASFLLECCPSIIIIFFLGRINRDDLVAGYGLGIIWVDCFGIGFLNGLACGLETMVSQAFGAKKYQLCGGIYNRAIAIMIISMLPIFFLQFFGSNILGLLNSNQTLIQNAAVLMRTMIPVVLLNGIFVATKCFLNGQNIYNYQFITQFIVIAFHLLWCYLFIEYLELGLIGAALSRIVTDILSNIILFSIMKISKCSDKVIVNFDMQYFTKWWPFLRYSVPIGAVLWLEWLCYEFYSIQASFLDEQKFGANVIMINFATLFYQVSYGISIAASTFVGSQMGKKDSAQAKKFALASFVLATVFLAITQTLLYFYKDQFSKLFTSTEAIQDEIKNCFTLLQIFLILDAYQGILTGVARAIGRENFSCYSFIFTYLIIGQTASYILCFTIDLELRGIWLGMIIGAGGYDLLQLIGLIFSDFEQLVDQIEKNIDLQDQPSLIEINDQSEADQSIPRVNASNNQY